MTLCMCILDCWYFVGGPDDISMQIMSHHDGHATLVYINRALKLILSAARVNYRKLKCM